MKKILAIVLIFIMLFSFAACGKDKDKGSANEGPSVDKNTLEIVNNAYAATKTQLAGVTALGYSGNAVKSVKVDDKEALFRMSFDFDYMNTDDGRKFAAEVVATDGVNNDEAQFYDDGKDIYAFKAGATYILSENKDTDAFVQDMFKDIEFFDASAIKVLDTTIVDTAAGGHGFVLEYDFNDANFDPEKTIGTDLFTEKAAGITVTPKGLRVSGIIDADGRLTSESVTYTYSYEQEVEVQLTDVDPDNSDAVTTEKVKKTFECSINFEFNFNYDIVEIKVPDRITYVETEPEGGETEGDGEAEGDGDTEEVKKPSEISISDFLKLSATKDDDSEEK